MSIYVKHESEDFVESQRTLETNFLRVHTNCCAIAARLQKAVVTASELTWPDANLTRSCAAVYFSVNSSSRSDSRPLRRGTSLSSRCGDTVRSRSSVHSRGIFCWHSARLRATRSCQLGVWVDSSFAMINIWLESSTAGHDDIYSQGLSGSPHSPLP